MNAFAKSAEWHAERLTGLGGSDANKIAAGVPAELIALWEEKTGRAEPEDLSGVLPVRIGSATEELNCEWFTRMSGREVKYRNQSFRHAADTFMRCEVDGLSITQAGHPAIFECKHVNAFGNIEDVIQRYMAQLHHNMHCVGVDWAVLSVIQGTQKYEYFEVELDVLYLTDLIEAERKFWQCVLDDVPPAHIEPLKAPVAPEAMIEVEMTGNNEWGDHAATWIEHRAAAQKFDGAVKGLKSLMEPHFGKAFGHGVIVSRAKNGNLSVKEMK